MSKINCGDFESAEALIEFLGGFEKAAEFSKHGDAIFELENTIPELAAKYGFNPDTLRKLGKKMEDENKPKTSIVEIAEVAVKNGLVIEPNFADLISSVVDFQLKKTSEEIFDGHNIDEMNEAIEEEFGSGSKIDPNNALGAVRTLLTVIGSFPEEETQELVKGLYDELLKAMPDKQDVMRELIPEPSIEKINNFFGVLEEFASKLTKRF